MQYKLQYIHRRWYYKKKAKYKWGGRESRYKSKNTVFQTFIFTLIKIICMQTENNLFVL